MTKEIGSKLAEKVANNTGEDSSIVLARLKSRLVGMGEDKIVFYLSAYELFGHDTYRHGDIAKAGNNLSLKLFSDNTVAALYAKQKPDCHPHGYLGFPVATEDGGVAVEMEVIYYEHNVSKTFTFNKQNPDPNHVHNGSMTFGFFLP